MIDTAGVQDDSEDPIHKGLGDVEHVLVGAESQTTWVGKFAIDDGLEHADSKVDSENAASRVLDVGLSHGARVSEEKRVVLLRKAHRVGSLQVVAIKVLNDRGDLDS